MGKKNIKNNPKYSSKYHLEREIDIIMNRLFSVKQNWLLFKELSTKENVEVICSRFPNMFNTIIKALKEKALLELAKLVVDLDNVETNSITINDLYNRYQKNKDAFKEKQYFLVREIYTEKRHKFNCYSDSIDSAMKQLKDDLTANKKIINFLKKKRNKSLAHNDKKMTFDTRNKYCKGKITIFEFDNFIDMLIKDINKISSCISGKQYAFVYTEIEELNCIRENLKVNQRKKKLSQ